MIKYFIFINCLFVFFSCSHSPQKKVVTAEQHRPLFHFTPPANWMNDPNGMVFYEGEYHLFYQYYPDSTVWGPMHWGHAVSKDMVHWSHLPIAIYPDSLGLIFSGSAVVDWNNTSGFGQNGKPPLVAIFTQHLMAGEKAGRHDFQYQSIAYSNDRGRTWTKYEGNPVIPNTGQIHDFRDPKVIWHEDSKQWIMIFAAKDMVQFWASPDLKKWNHLSDFGEEWGAHGGVWECPDFFSLRVEGTQETKWVLLQSINPGAPNGGSGTQYFIGDFDGTTFTLDPAFSKDVVYGKGVWLDWGRDNYAGVTWSDIPAKDGRRLFMGWMSNWDYAQVVPTERWRSAMTLPRSLHLHRLPAGYRLLSQPVQELTSLRQQKTSIKPQAVKDTFDLVKAHPFSANSAELMLEIELPDNPATDFSIVLSNDLGESYRIGYNAADSTFFSDRTKAGKSGFSEKFATKIHTATRSKRDKKLDLHLFFDTASCELFADRGEVVLTDIFFPTSDFTHIKLVAEGGEILIKSGTLWQLKRAL
jgi:fructan beta-fructosidase